MFVMRPFDRSNHAGRRFVAMGAAFWYLFVALGLPLERPAGKDLSRPFPCMYSRCGCRTAEQCYRRCCCHTARERLAFAAKHGVTPPEELLAKVRVAQREVSTCASPRCCEPGGARKSEHCKREELRVASATADVVVMVEALVCQGAGQYWLVAGAVLPPQQVDFQLFEFCFDWAASISVRVVSPTHAPPTPPPKLS